ncbi:MAG: phytoene desaturase family protein [Sphingobacterium sp.]
MSVKEYDVIVIGSGPNGFSAAITLQQQGLSTLLIEGTDTIGGGMRTKELTLPGFKHDICSAIHPMAMASPFFSSLPLDKYGLKFIYAPYQAAHPLLSGETALLHRDLQQTVREFGADGDTYLSLVEPVINNWEKLARDIMGPLRFPNAPLLFAKFGLNALQPATWIAKRFKTEKVRALWGGMAGHGIQPLSNYTTSAIGIVLAGIGHKYGWPIPVGGSQAIANALSAHYCAIGGEIAEDYWLTDRADLPKHKILVLNLTPQQILKIEGLDLTPDFRKQLERYRQGMGVFKVDWALSNPAPFKDGRCGQAATVHLGDTFSEIARNEQLTNNGRLVAKPFVLFTQQSVFDKSRAPEGKHTAWAYCHVPHGSISDRTDVIENQLERYAPGFKDTIIARSTINTKQLEAYNPNYVGGDINGGVMDILQLYTRPTWRFTPYRTSNRSVYICSSSTPPGGGVHGMSGFHAANTVLKDHYNMEVKI